MLSKKISQVVPLKDMELLVFFENGSIKKFDVKPIVNNFPEYEDLKNADLFNLVAVEPGGYGISWNSELDCSEGELWEGGIDIPLDADDFVSYVRYNTVSTGEVTEILGCSRQNIDSYVRRERLTPVKDFNRTKLFLKSDIERLSKN